MEDHILELENITKTFPGVIALENVSFKVRKKEVLGLIGENGAGKSTVLKVLNGWYPFGTFKGTIKIKGDVENFHSPHDANLKGIGYVPQEINVINELSIAENIFVGNIERKVFSLKGIIEKAKKLLNEINIDLDPKIYVRMLSISQKQLLMIARALSRNPKVLILDEPTSTLASNDVENLFNIVRKLKENGTSIIFVTHKLEEIMNITDRVVILRDGHYISTYMKEKYSEELIISDMVGRKIENLYPARVSNIGKEVLRVENLTVEHPRIKNRNIVDNLSFRLHKGEVLGLAGLVGAGRTETLNAIYGSYPAKSGKIFINERETSITNVRIALNNGIGMVTEDRKNDGLLLLDNIKRNISISNINKIMKKGILISSLEEVYANKYMKLLNIKAPNVNTIVVNLSGGNQQKVVIAKTLYADPKIILLDDPTKGIDVGSKNEIYHLINKLVETGISFIMTSSELPELIAMCDRTIVLSGGIYKGEFTKSEASQEKIIALCLQ